MKVCPHCGGAYPVAEGFCPMDGSRLRTQGVGGPPQPSGPQVEALLGTVLDRRYRLDAVIGEGGMGLVFRATHVLIGKSLAVKLLRREHVEAPDVARRFLLEARVASSLKHPNVVDINDFGEIEGGGAYYVMELLEGRTLANRIDQDGPLTPAEAVVAATQICAGLSAAHAVGVVHRDLKPDNVFLAESRHSGEHPVVKLLDFGIARAGPRRITVMGAVLGTPEYMSPEMAQGHDVDHRADLYALGVMLFEMLTGTVPFYDKEVAKTLELHVFAPRPTIASRKPELAKLVRIGELVDSLLSIAREQRPRDADEVMRSLRAAWAHDLDADTAAVVQRATLAIGSNRMPDQNDPSGRRDWSAPAQWPAGHADPPAGRAPSPEPRIPTHVLPVAIAKPKRGGQLRAAAIAVSTAAVACVITLGVAKWLEAGTTSTAEASAPSEPASEPLEAEVDATPIAPVVAEPLEPQHREEPQAQGGGAIPSETTPATPPTPADVIPIATPVGSTDEKTAAVVDRSKKLRKRPAESHETSGATSPSPTAPAATDPPAAPARPSEPTPADSGGTRLPGDLKDPFPGK
ncbi:MAG TPA: serine/threonine-protein kinase [Nannocystaceae bacterium]|nr:serine/threonine-protein kinase [Nannocystaceae bacterium]